MDYYVLIYVDVSGEEHVLAKSEYRRDMDNLKMDIEKFKPSCSKIILKVEYCSEVELAE